MRSAMAMVIALAFAAPAPGQTFAWATAHGGKLVPSRFTFTVGGRNCTVENDGYGVCRRKGARPWPFRLAVEHNSWIETLALAAEGDDLLFVYGVTDIEYGWARAARLDRGGRKARWSINLDGDWPALPVWNNDAIYVAGGASVERIDAANGGIEWRIQRAYHRYSAAAVHLAGGAVRVTWKSDDGGKTRDECFEAETGEPAPCP